MPGAGSPAAVRNPPATRPQKLKLPVGRLSAESPTARAGPRTSRGLLDATHVDARSTAPGISGRPARCVERRIRDEGPALHGLIPGYRESVPVACDAEDDLLCWESGSGPCGNGALCGALLVRAGGACVGKRCIRADGGGPGAPYVVVHDLDEVEHGGEGGDVGGGRASGVREGGDGCRGAENEAGGRAGGTELLEEEEEVGRVGRGDGVAANALVVRVFPAAPRLLSASGCSLVTRTQSRCRRSCTC